MLFLCLLSTFTLFEDINVCLSFLSTAYELLSDEEKRKNYDLYGDEKGNPGFHGGHPGGQDGYTYFTGGGPGQSHFNFKPGGDWQGMVVFGG